MIEGISKIHPSLCCVVLYMKTHDPWSTFWLKLSTANLLWIGDVVHLRGRDKIKNTCWQFIQYVSVPAQTKTHAMFSGNFVYGNPNRSTIVITCVHACVFYLQHSNRNQVLPDVVGETTCRRIIQLETQTHRSDQTSCSGVICTPGVRISQRCCTFVE